MYTNRISNINTTEIRTLSSIVVTNIISKYYRRILDYYQILYVEHYYLNYRKQ